MQKRLSLFGFFLVLVSLLCIMAIIPVASQTNSPIDPTDQRETVNALVDERLTATALERTLNAPTLTPTPLATQTAIPTLTLMPSPTFENNTSISANQETSLFYDVSDEAFDLYQTAWEHYWRGNLRNAVNVFSDGIEIEPEWAELYFSRGITVIDRGEYDDALEDFMRVEDLLDDVDVGLRSWRIFVHAEEGNLDEAIIDGEIILTNKPYETVAISNLIFAYISEERYQDALTAARIALFYEPNDNFILNQLTLIHDELGNRDYERFYEDMVDGINANLEEDYNDAIDFFKDAIDRAEEENLDDFDHALAYWNLALAELGEEDYDDAFEALDNAEDLYPDMGAIYYLQAVVELSDGDFEDELELYNQAIEFAPDFYRTYILRGLYYEATGNPEAAILDHWQWQQLTRTHFITWLNVEPSNDELLLPFFAGWEHRFIVEGDAGDSLTVQAQDSDIGDIRIDALIVILDERGNPIASNDDERSGRLDAEISDFELPADGDYTVVISTGIGGNLGLMEVEIELD